MVGCWPVFLQDPWGALYVAQDDVMWHWLSSVHTAMYLLLLAVLGMILSLHGGPLFLGVPLYA